MQLLTIAGTIGRDAVLRQTQSGDSVLGFSVAVDQGKDKNGNKRDPAWYDCSIWGKRANSLERYFVKGLKITAWGRPSAREHNGKAYLQLMIDDFTFQGGGQSRCGQSQEYNQGGGYAQTPVGGDMDDEMPF